MEIGWDLAVSEVLVPTLICIPHMNTDFRRKCAVLQGFMVGLSSIFCCFVFSQNYYAETFSMTC